MGNIESAKEKLLFSFPGSFINHCNEFIAHKAANEYFSLKDCENELDIQCKVLEWLSRGTYKTCPFDKKSANDRFHNFMLECVNDFLGTDFAEDDMELIYTYLGNSCHHKLTIEFVQSGFDKKIIENYIK